jgi:hypothetical protein
MAWTAPRTWTTGEVVTAAMMNAHIRDNLLETSAATATTAGDIVYADAANSMGSRLGIASAPGILATTGSAPVWRSVAQLVGDVSNTTTSSSFVDFDAFDPVGTAVTVTLTTGTRALIWFGARGLSTTTAGANVQLSYRVSGATTTASSIAWEIFHESGAANDTDGFGRAHLATLTAGSNTFTVQALTSAGTATILYPYIIVMAL